MDHENDKTPMEPVLVTGGAGFLGRYLVAALAARGHPVTVLDNLLSTNSTFAAEQLGHPRITHLRGSVFDRDLVADLVSRHKAIVHLATVVGVEETISQTVATMDNLGGTLNLVRCLTPDHVILFSSSADVYGAHSMLYDRPMRETDFFVFEHGLVNRWVYPHVKALEENLVSNSPARSVVIRVFNTYGPAMDYPDPKRVIPHFVTNLLAGTPLLLSGDGSQTRSFCYVDDMVRGMVAAFDFVRSKSAPCAECFNLGNDDTVTIHSLAQRMVALGRELGLTTRELPIVPHAFNYTQSFNDTWNRVPDITHARRAFGFDPSVTLQEGLRRTLAHYLRTGSDVSGNAQVERRRQV